jgi:hypothetical protein
VKDHSARLDETEAAYLEIPNPTAAKIHAYFAEGTPKKGCGCGLGEACKHGPPRLPGPDGAPYALRTVQDWLKAVKGRLRARAGRRREDNRARNAAVFDRLRVQAERQGDLREAINATARLAELDGSHLAAEPAPKVLAILNALEPDRCCAVSVVMLQLAPAVRDVMADVSDAMNHSSSGVGASAPPSANRFAATPTDLHTAAVAGLVEL